jgi:hypothetical protein
MTTSDTNDGFFNRPVKIASVKWDPAIKLFLEFNPWTAFCEDPRVANRLAHFKNLKMGLNVQVLINGNPFYYGRAIMSYVPMHRVDEVSVFRDSILSDLVEASQRPHIYIDPCKSEGGELELPYVFPKPFMDVPSRDWRKIGKMFLSSVNSLEHANGGTEPVTITIFAYATNVELNTPTSRVPVDLAPQAGEYGIVSLPAARIVLVAKRLADAPMIGKFMRATAMISDTVSQVAVMFGYSRARLIPNDSSLICQFGECAVTDFPDTSVSLAVSVKKEVTIDPRVVGLAPHDEMALVPLAMRESYLDTFTWTENDNTDQHLYSFDVSPMSGRKAGLEHHMTPMAWVANPFTYWKGSIEMRLQVVCSAYHRGRLRVVYDPDYVADPSIYNVNYSMLMDISESTEAVFKIGWGQNFDYLEIQNLTTALEDQPRSTFVQTKNPFANGRLGIFVVNPLTSPSDEVASISLNVFVRACDDFEVAVPKCGSISKYVVRKREIEPDPEDGDTELFTSGIVSTWGSGYLMQSGNPLNVGVVAQPITIFERPNSIGIQSYSSTNDLQNLTITLRNSGDPLGMDILFKGTRYPFNMSANETRNFEVPWSVAIGWNVATVTFDFDQFSDPFDVMGMIVGYPTDFITNTLGGLLLQGLAVGSTALVSYDSPFETESYLTTSEEALVIQLPPEFATGSRAIVYMTSDSVVNGRNLDLANTLSPTPIRNYKIDAIVPLNRRITITRPSYVPAQDWTPQLLAVSFIADQEYQPQSGEVEDRNHDTDTANAPEAVDEPIKMGPASDIAGLNEIYFGEVVSSWRQMLKRFTSYGSYFADNTPSTSRARIILPLYPVEQEDLTGSGGDFTISTENILPYVLSAYVCMRGSTRVKVTRAPTSASNATLTRVPDDSFLETSQNFLNLTKWCATARDTTANKPYKEFELPVYTNLRFTQPRNFGPGIPNDFLVRQRFELTIVASNTTIPYDVSYAAAEDFSLSFFLSTPVLLLA